VIIGCTQVRKVEKMRANERQLGLGLSRSPARVSDTGQVVLYIPHYCVFYNQSFFIELEIEVMVESA
jgi:hypothetical protein